MPRGAAGRPAAFDRRWCATAVARALINEPSLLPTDEPTGAPDADSRDRTTELLSGLPRHYSCGPLVVTHDPDIAARADRTQRLSAGSLSSPLPAHRGVTARLTVIGRKVRECGVPWHPRAA